MKQFLEFKRTISKGRNTYGYNICSLYVDEKKVSSCNGRGYDMEGTCLGNFIAKKFKSKFSTINKKFYGLSFFNPDYKTPQAIIHRELQGDIIGLERYQAFHTSTSDTPTAENIVPLIDGVCGFSSVEKIIEAIGLKLTYLGKNKYLLEDD